MTVNIVADWAAKKGKCDEVLGIVRDVIAETRAFEGCESVRVLRDGENNDRLLLIERWASRDRYVAYQEWRRETGVGGQIRDLLERPPQFRTLDDVDM